MISRFTSEDLLHGRYQLVAPVYDWVSANGRCMRRHERARSSSSVTVSEQRSSPCAIGGSATRE